MALQLTNFTSSGSTISLGATRGIDGISLTFGSDNAAALSAWSTSTANLSQAKKSLMVQQYFQSPLSCNCQKAVMIQLLRSADLRILPSLYYDPYQEECISCLAKMGKNTAATRLNVTTSHSQGDTCQGPPAAHVLRPKTRQGLLMLETTNACALDHQQPPVLLQKAWLSSRAAWHWFHPLPSLAPTVKCAVVCGVQDRHVQLGELQVALANLKA